MNLAFCHKRVNLHYQVDDIHIKDAMDEMFDIYNTT